MDRPIKPYEEVKAMLGPPASDAWEQLAGHIRYHYVMDEWWEPGNPNHKYYNNLRFRRGGKTLITLCLRDGYFTACIVLGKEEQAKFEAQRELFSQAFCDVYDATHVYHDGRWLGFDVSDDTWLEDICRVLPIKRKPNRKVLPASLAACGRLDVGLTHEAITDCVMA